jgi:hypothetical protein
MKLFTTVALLIVLACAPSLAQAGVTVEPLVVASKVPSRPLAVPAASVDSSPSATGSYAAREAAAPQLAEFTGGGGGVYIGTGALLVALIVVVAVLILR